MISFPYANGFNLERLYAGRLCSFAMIGGYGATPCTILRNKMGEKEDEGNLISMEADGVTPSIGSCSFPTISRHIRIY